MRAMTFELPGSLHRHESNSSADVSVSIKKVNISSCTQHYNPYSTPETLSVPRFRPQFTAHITNIVVSLKNVNNLGSNHNLSHVPPSPGTSIHGPRARQARVFSSSCLASTSGSNPFDSTMGQASAQAQKLGAAIQRSIEGFNVFLTGGGGGGGSNGHNGGKAWGDGEGDMSGDSIVETTENFLTNEEEETQEIESNTNDAGLDLSKLDPGQKYVCSMLKLVSVEGVAVDEEFALREILGISSGGCYFKKDLEDAVSRLFDTGWYRHVCMRFVSQPGGALTLTVVTEDASYSGISSFQFINVRPESHGIVYNIARKGGEGGGLCHEIPFSARSLLPKSIQTEISRMLQMSGKVSQTTLRFIQERIENWYHSHGYVYAKVRNFRNSEAGALQCHVTEGNITQLSVSCEDEFGQCMQCHTNTDVIVGKLPLAVREGMQYNVGAGKAALHAVEQLGLFEKVSVLPAADVECGDVDGVALKIRVRERPLHSASLSSEWSFLCNDSGRPTLRTLQPGGSLCVKHGNIRGLNRSVSGSIATSNLQRPQDDLRYKLEYLHPYVGGLQNPHICTLRVGAFSKRKLTAVFNNEEIREGVPAVWVDRAGIKASLTEKFSRQSKIMYGLVVEEVATRDKDGTIHKQRGRNSSCRDSQAAGPSIGIDHIGFLQIKITRSNTYSGDTGIIGARDVFQAIKMLLLNLSHSKLSLKVDQGLGLGTRAPVFNRHQLALTRYIPLQRDIPPTEQPPSVAVLHARYGGCLGDLPSYRSFTNGGPYALRGHNTGELASYSRFIEVAGELRIPVQQVEAYGFLESLTNLQNFSAIWNNPGSLVGRVGKGIMYGAGIKMGNLRAEYVIDCNDQIGSVKVYFGERY